MLKFFDGINEKEIRSCFTSLCKKLHPDNGGDAEQFKEMIAEYKALLLYYANISASCVNNAKTEDERKRAAQNEKSYRASADCAEKYADFINELCRLNGLIIELSGSWLWVSGDTMSHREQIKSYGFLWSKTHKQWYWYPGCTESKKQGYRVAHTKDYIRTKYGSEFYKGQKIETLEG